MNPGDPLADSCSELIEAYCDGVISEEDIQRLEAYLLHNADVRRDFVAAFHLHTELQFAMRARRAADAALQRVRAAAPMDQAGRPRLDSAAAREIGGRDGSWGPWYSVWFSQPSWSPGSPFDGDLKLLVLPWRNRPPIAAIGTLPGWSMRKIASGPRPRAKRPVVICVLASGCFLKRAWRKLNLIRVRE